MSFTNESVISRGGGGINEQGRLGCGEPQFFITDRCAQSGVFCVLDGNLVSGKWTRVLDEVSVAEVVMSFGGDVESTCCECLAEVEPWCHELHIWRDGEEVWVGPIQEIEYAYEEVTIKAKDSLAWLDVRIPSINIDYTDTGAGATNLTTIAEYILNLAYADDGPIYTCELDNLFSVAVDAPDTQRFFEKFTQTALQCLQELAETELDYTVIGRTIILFGDSTPLTPLILLNDEHIIGDVTITKDGLLQGNRYYVHFEEDLGDPALGEDLSFYCYGPIERIRDGGGLYDLASAEHVADEYVKASSIAPRILEIPSSSKLSPDTPWTINEMVPGARVDVAITRLCLNMTQSFILKMVETEYDADGESVRLSLTPMNSIATG